MADRKDQHYLFKKKPKTFFPDLAKLEDLILLHMDRTCTVEHAACASVHGHHF